MGSLLYLKKDTFQFPSGKKIIKAREYQTYLDAKEIIEKAQHEAERIKTEAKEAFKIEKKRGYEAGLKEGKKYLSQQMIGTVNSAVNYLSKLEEKVVGIVTTALRKIVGEIDDNTLIIKVVKNTLAVVRDQKQVTLKVATEQVDSVKGTIDSILKGYPGINYIDVVGDKRIEKGGCILETEIGVVDASLNVQIEAIKKSLTKELKGSKQYI